MEEYKKAIFAGGCFWCMEPPFAPLKGVVQVLPGYTGGKTENPTYEEVCTGITGHYEAVEVTYNPDLTTYEELLQVFWRQIDPTDPYGQFADKGKQYQTAIFYGSEEEKAVAEKSKAALESSGRFGRAVATKILPAEKFYPAESYHCRYYEKNPEHYNRYKKGSGRQDYIHKVWGKGDGA